MSAPYGPPWGGPPWGRGSSYRRASQSDPSMRVSHDERTQVADRLSKHYGDGRLDEEEFNDRLDRAMKAKTRGDLYGLFDDLPDAPPAQEPHEVIPQRHRRPLFGRLVFFILAIVLISAVWHAVAWPFWAFGMGGFSAPWLLIAIIVFLLLRRSGGWHRHHH
jgi:hypothetical protein